ncbi:MAG: hypothetical protein KF768_08650 [Phycisphaeraceae bacterium]|nr:hypothetical protein [Phycisphaeraceae bacterium]
MRIDSNIPPTTPFHIARAYNARPVEPVSNRIVATPVDPVARIGREQQPSALQDPQIRRLVGAIVPGSIEFDEPAARVESGSDRGSGVAASPSRVNAFPMYRHPSDRNAAATNVHVGRSLDVSA